MTATAMILGMLPMSLGIGEGGEQNAPLGRAVIGGLMFATSRRCSSFRSFIVPGNEATGRSRTPAQERERETELLSHAIQRF